MRRLLRYLGYLIMALLVMVVIFLFSPFSEFSRAKQITLLFKYAMLENFRNMDKLLPTKTMVSTSTQNIILEPANNIHFPAFQDYKPIARNLTNKYNNLNEWLEKSNTTSFLVWKNGVLLHEQYSKGSNRKSLFTSWSLIKSIVGTLAGIAYSEGKIQSLDDSVTKYLPDWNGWEKVTIKDVIEMRTGVAFDEEYSHTFADINTIFPKAFWFNMPFGEQVKRFPIAIEPGKKFEYKSINTHVLSLVVSAAVHESIFKFASDELFVKMGHESPIKWVIDNSGAPLGFCCINMSARDYLRFGILALKKGQITTAKGENLRIGSPSFWEVATKPFAGGEPGTLGNKMEFGFGLHWWIPPKNIKGELPGDFSAMGLWGQYLYINPAQQVVIVKTSADSTPNPVDDTDFFREISDLVN